MLRAQSHPDEFILGYRGRLRVLNLFPTVANLMAALRDEVHPLGTPLRECPVAVTLALADGTSLQSFVRSHSLLPFHRAIDATDVCVAHGDPSRLVHVSRWGTRLWRRSAASFCRECVKEDIGFWGFAYWRRSHQLPGVHWCLKHGGQLARSLMGARAFDDMPSLDFAARHEFSENEFQTMRDNPVVRRYAEIVNKFLESERPTDLVHARYLIAEQAKKYRVRTWKPRRQPTMTNLALEQVPLQWLRTQYPSINAQIRGKWATSIDKITSGRTTSPGYALALALLFESADEALNHFFRGKQQLPSAREEPSGYWLEQLKHRVDTQSKCRPTKETAIPE